MILLIFFLNMGTEGLKVIIVGAGFAGLTAAIECRNRGMHPILIESYPTSRDYGDIIDFLPNGGMHFDRWDNGRVTRRLLEVCLNDTDTLDYLAFDGRKILEEPFLLKPEHFHQMLAGHRGEMHQIICDYATEIGVEMQFGNKVIQYLDTDEELGVVLETGKKILGDVVVASDGPKSLGRTQILGLPESKVNSGYAIYRAFYELTDEHRANPWLKEQTRVSPNCAQMWIGKDIHGFLYSWKKGTTIGWVLTHKVGQSFIYPVACFVVSFVPLFTKSCFLCTLIAPYNLNASTNSSRTMQTSGSPGLSPAQKPTPSPILKKPIFLKPLNK